MEYFRARTYKISWSGDITPRYNLTENLQKQARCLLWENGYTQPMKFRLVHIDGITGFSSKLILSRRDKSLVILKNTKILILIKLRQAPKLRNALKSNTH